MRGLSKAFLKYRMKVSTRPPLSKILAKSFITVIDWVSQLCLFRYACQLSDKSLCSSKCAIIFEQTTCSSNSLGAQIRETGRYLQAKELSPFWYRGHMFASDHSLGISSVSIDCWKRWANIGPNSDASSFKTLGWSSSSPKAFEEFKSLGSFVTPSAETWMSSMKDAERLGRGTWVYSLLLRSSVN